MRPFFHGLQRTLFYLFFALVSIATDAENTVSFSSQGGFYDSPFYLTLSCPQRLTIHFTLNGNEPTSFDKVYEQPLLLDERQFSKSNLYTIQTCPNESWFVPDTIQKCIVIRAAAFDADGNRIGPVLTNSYFIKSLGTYPMNLPIVSLCADSLALFGYEEGILLQDGAHNNCFQHGRNWERLCNVEFYEHDNSGINQQAGLRTHGSLSREGIQKGLKLYARKEYGNNRFKHKFFETTDIQSFNHLALKPFRNGWLSDHICTLIAQPLNFETTQSRPVVLFLNGEYWGLYFLKERPKEQFIANHYGFKKENICIIESWTGKTSSGNNDNFVKMMQWFLEADLSNDDEYKQACQLIDLNCFIDYYCFQLFVANGDWPDNNMRCWQANDGKWRWIFFDGDCCLTSYPNMLTNTLYNTKNKNLSTLVFTKLFENEDFRNQFYKRFGRLLTHELDPRNTKAYFTNCVNSIETEMDLQFQRFGYMGQKRIFEFQIRYMDNFLSYRMVSAAAMVYQLYSCNGWRFSNSKTSSESAFRYKANNRRPAFLFRMARQFKDWRYVNRYFAYERYRLKNEIKNSKPYQYLKEKRFGTKYNKRKEAPPKKGNATNGLVAFPMFAKDLCQIGIPKPHFTSTSSNSIFKGE